MNETEERKVFEKYRKTKLKFLSYRNGILTYTGNAEDGAIIDACCGDDNVCCVFIKEEETLDSLNDLCFCWVTKDAASKAYHSFGWFISEEEK